MHRGPRLSMTKSLPVTPIHYLRLRTMSWEGEAIVKSDDMIANTSPIQHRHTFHYTGWQYAFFHIQSLPLRIALTRKHSITFLTICRDGNTFKVLFEAKKGRLGAIGTYLRPSLRPSPLISVAGDPCYPRTSSPPPGFHLPTYPG